MVAPIHSAVKMFLTPLSKLELRELGLELGLRWRRLKNVKNDCMLDDILDSWLREDDDVTETSGHPSWLSLVKALEEVGNSHEAEEKVSLFLCVLHYTLQNDIAALPTC